MLTKELSDLVAQVALSLSDRPVPTAAEILAGLSRLAEQVDAAGYSRGYAQGVVAGSTHTARVMDRVLLGMSAP